MTKPLALDSTATEHHGWHKYTDWQPSAPGLYLVTVHPGGTENWSVWSGTHWGVYGSTPAQAEHLAKIRFALPATCWFKGEAVQRVTYTGATVMLKRAVAFPKSTPHNTYNAFFGVVQQIAHVAELDEVAEVDIGSWDDKDKTPWRKLGELPDVPGVYEAIDSLGFRGPVEFNGRKWTTKVAKWRGLNTKAHVKALKGRELRDSEF